MVIIKPAAMERHLLFQVIERIMRLGDVELDMVRRMRALGPLISAHYCDLQDRIGHKRFAQVCANMMRGPSPA